MSEKVVLAYSGGLDTSVILHWLKYQKGLNVIAYVADLGQGGELDNISERAMKTGASKVYVADLREEFVSDFIFPMIKANAIYEGQYLLGTSIARPIIAQKQVEIAKKEKAKFVAHGSTGKGNDQVRFELTYMALNPSLKIIVPWREWDFSSRTDLIDYAEKYKIPVPVTKSKPYSSDRNLYHISFEGGILEDPWSAPPEDIFKLTVSPERAPHKPEEIEIEFKEGSPTQVNGKALKPHDLLKKLNELGGSHGIGRVDVVENRFVGMKSRGVYETPGGTLLLAAHRALEGLTLDREVMHFKDSLITKYSELVYYGFWFSPEMRLLNKTIEETQKNVSGIVRLKLYKGSCRVTGRKSPYSLYLQDLATFEGGSLYDPKDATGFIRLNALRLKLQAMREKTLGKNRS
ncbi:MAG: argininosuccinate synthase [Chlamydiae bacterium]|nr:argininosuccinate synthase [Chlamydiota bacterium]MBI3277668.1 argininosuccinate synthase [Chlamydiota bacterium]